MTGGYKGALRAGDVAAEGDDVDGGREGGRRGYSGRARAEFSLQDGGEASENWPLAKKAAGACSNRLPRGGGVGGGSEVEV